MAMLLRRLKDRVVESKPGALQCIGTSATLGGSEKILSSWPSLEKDCLARSLNGLPVTLHVRM